MIGMIKLGETSPKLLLAALSLAIDLEEMEFFVEIRKLIQTKLITGIFATWLRALDKNVQVRTCKSATEMVNINFELFIQIV